MEHVSFLFPLSFFPKKIRNLIFLFGCTLFLSTPFVAHSASIYIKRLPHTKIHYITIYNLYLMWKEKKRIKFYDYVFRRHSSIINFPFIFIYLILDYGWLLLQNPILTLQLHIAVLHTYFAVTYCKNKNREYIFFFVRV